MISTKSSLDDDDDDDDDEDDDDDKDVAADVDRQKLQFPSKGKLSE